MEEIASAGGQAVSEMNGALNSFLEWAKSFLTWTNLFRFLGTLIVLFAIFVVYKIIARSIKKVPEQKLSQQRSMVILKILNYLFYFVVIMFILSRFGIKLSAIWGAAGVAGIAVAFAAQTSVSNIISGIFVIAEKALKIGDLINVAGETGIVDSVGLLSVKIHTLDNQMIRIPNSTIINSNLRNTSYFSQRRMDFQVSVAYDTDMQSALDTLASAPKYCKTILKNPAPIVWFDGFGDSGIKLTLAVWFKGATFFETKNETFVAIKRVFDEAGIEIPYSKVDVNLYEGTTKEIAASKAASRAKTAATSAQKASKRSASKSKALGRASKAKREMTESESAKSYNASNEA